MGIPKGGIAFFDSGIGGLTVLAECKKRMPQQLFYYYGDNGNAPYGNLSPKTVRKYVRKVFRQIARRKPRAAVLACNTATALCAEELRRKYAFPVVGAEPALLLGAKKGGEVLVLSTKATFESARFQSLRRRAAQRFPAVRFSAYPCEGLAGEIERRLPSAGRDFTSLLPEATPDVVVLGCTHYVYIKEQIESFYGCPAVDGNAGIAARLQCVLDDERAARAARKPCRPTRKNNGASGAAFVEKKGKNKKTPPRSVDGVYFLGGYAEHNLHIYEQMFVLRVGKKG